VRLLQRPRLRRTGMMSMMYAAILAKRTQFLHEINAPDSASRHAL
jgi:hypothetical protein